MIKTNRTKDFLFEKNWNFSRSSGWRCVFFDRSYYLFIEEDEMFTSPAGWGQRGEMVPGNSQKVAISFQGHDKPRLMGVAIAIDPFQVFFFKIDIFVLLQRGEYTAKKQHHSTCPITQIGKPFLFGAKGPP